MDTVFDGFEPELKDLRPKVKEKALELASELMKKHGYDKPRAIREAIEDAEAWFLDMEG